jgi:enhancer of mRNA-decapping protein 3
VSDEIQLFAATGNHFSYNANTLPSCDLVIAAVLCSQMNNGARIKNWLASNRAPVLAIDPPVDGIQDVPVKCSVLPILPLDDLNVRALGKLYLCNLSIPDKFYADSGITYRSPFDRFVIPIHKQD